jgi:hypothetical protein
MADYYTKFSVILPLPDEAAQTYALDLAGKASRALMQDGPSDTLPDSIQDMIEVWNFETVADNRDGKWGIWLNGEQGGVDAACAFIQHLLQKFIPQGRVEFEWSNDCSKPRVDAYGGGAVIITARKIKSMSTTEWLRRHAVR